jgi:pimeloyl-ACP methyl ester carboxylesterase
MHMQAYSIQTSHGRIAVEESGKGDVALLMIHGNSSSGEVFRPQFQSTLADNYRLIAIDLPGHGKSDNALDPARTYTRPGFGGAVIEVIQKLELERPVIFGWSLGGHIALEIMPRLPMLRGVAICGTPPVGTVMSEGFRPSPGMKYGSQEHLSAEDIEAFGEKIFGASFNPQLRDALTRADGLARKTMFEAARAGAGVDQRWVAEHIDTPLAVINGADDSIINLDYIDCLQYANLWSGECHRISGAGHAAFRERPGAFNALLAQFLAEVS